MLLDIEDHRDALGRVIGIVILPVEDQFGELLYHQIEFQADAQLIDDILNNVDFQEPQDGGGLGVEQDAIVYMKLQGDLVAKYIVVGGFRFLLRDGDWEHLFTIRAVAAQKFRDEL